MIQYIVILGALVQLWGIWAYLKDVIKGTTKPNRVTWLLWSIAPMIGTAAAISKGVEWAVLPVFICGFAPLIVFIVSFVNKDAYWKLGIFDYLCGAGSILALILWGITKDPVIAIALSLMADGLAATPTIIKTIKNPETETLEAYTTGIFNAGTSFVAMKMWTFSEVAFPVYLLIMNIVMVVIIYFGNKKREQKTR